MRMAFAVNNRKSKVLQQPAPDAQHLPSTIKVHDKTLDSVDSSITREPLYNEGRYRRQNSLLSQTVFGQLKEKIFEDQALNAVTKFIVFRAFLSTRFLYNYEA